MASSRLVILFLLVALTLSSNAEATMARRLLNIPGLPNMGSFPMPTLQSPSFPLPPFGPSPPAGTGFPFFSIPTTMPTTPSFPGIFTPPIIRF
ncbi:hypothetical protein Ccrd_010688 [Cynara cardunculus var. scolymus]|uniref:Uncharacterized protein n=1 Tax=Cynara cardunculus var. scolymus TaxID=59895 RepID=A0A103YKN5_CYNCS|nr:hypothetical protein Ccrd_010688 [Cynara cardunculus var. scolymus]